MNADISVTPARPDDTETIAALLAQMDRFYGVTDSEPNERRIRNIREALFGDRPAAYALLAWHERLPVGFASYSFLWPASGSSRSLYIKELYVTDSWRGAGVGRLLMDDLRQTAAEYRCDRIEWTTDGDNLDAQRFYKRLGFEPLTSKIFYRSVHGAN